jgi:hypothetical protein
MKHILSLLLLFSSALNAGLNISKMSGSRESYRAEVAASVAFYEQETYAPDGKRTRDVIYFVEKEAKTVLDIVNENSQWIERKSVPVTTKPSSYSVALALKALSQRTNTATLACVITKNNHSKDIEEKIITIPLGFDFKETYKLDLEDDSNKNLTLTIDSRLYQ